MNSAARNLGEPHVVLLTTLHSETRDVFLLQSRVRSIVAHLKLRIDLRLPAMRSRSVTQSDACCHGNEYESDVPPSFPEPIVPSIPLYPIDRPALIPPLVTAAGRCRVFRVQRAISIARNHLQNVNVEREGHSPKVQSVVQK